MNAQIEHLLKVHVERIVRPIVARESDKLRMREELYAHAMEAARHEVQAGVDEATSAQRALERLGEPEVVRQELQATVFWISRADYWIDRVLTRPTGTSLFVHAAKAGALLAGAITVSFLILLSLPYLFFTQKVCNGEVCELIGFAEVWPKLIGVGGRMFPFFAFAAFNSIVFTGLQTRVSGWVGRGLRFTTGGLAVAALLLTQAGGLLLLVVVQGDSVSFEDFCNAVAWLAFFTSIVVLPLMLLAMLNAWKRDRYVEWLSLNLNETVAE